MYISKINSAIYNNFKGKNTGTTQPRYDVSYKFGALRSGETDYSSKSGDYVVTVKGALPIIKRKELYYPDKETKVIIRRTKDGIKKVTLTPTETVTQIFDKSAILKQDKDFSILDKGNLDIKNGEISRLTVTTLGSRYLLQYDKKLNRTIYVEEKPEGRRAKVIDAKTGKPITSGDRILNTTTNEDGENIVENILTGKVLSRYKYRYQSNKLEYQILYHKDSNVPKYSYNYISSTGASKEKFFDESGNLLRDELNSPSGKSKEIRIYNKDGNIVSHRKETYGFAFGKKKPVIEEVIYNPTTGKIDKITENKMGQTIITRYFTDEETGENYPSTIEYIKDGKLNTFEKLQHNGEYVLSRMTFNKLYEASYQSFDKKGYPESINYFDKNGNLTVSLDYIPISGKLASVTKYKPDNKGYRQYIYPTRSEYPINIINVDENNQIQKITLNLDNKNCPKKLSKFYFEDGRFTMNWLNKEPDITEKLPKLPNNKIEALELIDSLEAKSKNACRIRQYNFIRKG